jgi:putative PIN family toxin of toxin-antitoxin system
MMVALIDSGIWISAIHYGGVPMAAVQAALQNDQLLTCDTLENEVVGVMHSKFRYDPYELGMQLAVLLRNATRVTLIGTLNDVCRDPKDNFLLECALLGNADVIISDDKDLLSLNPYKSTKILTPRQYLDRLHYVERPVDFPRKSPNLM